MAYIQIQTQNWTFRNEWSCEHYGGNGANWVANGGDSDGSFDGLFHTDPDTGGVKPGTFNDAVIAGNGTYRVSIDGFNLTADDSETFNILGISTNIPNEGNPLTFSDIKVIMNGRNVASSLSGDWWVIQGIDTRDANDYYLVHVINQWNSDLGGSEGLFGYMMPTDELALEFTVSGFSYDKEEDEIADEGGADEGAANDTPANDNTAGNAGESDDDDGGFPIWAFFAFGGAAVAIIIAVVAASKKKK
jgi:hypothetical protein